MSKRSNDIDELVGRNIRIHRINRGISQTEFARAIGVTFQQVQKYEDGTNRVGSGRLFKIASFLSVAIPAFFEGAEHLAGDCNGHSPVALLSEPYALRLVQAFCAIENVELRRSMVELVQGMANAKANLIVTSQTA